ncbi:MAG: NADH-quinone oxidoreductase subunit J [Bdellovibrio sp.]|nr:NADH-quinone oxidoreductase subunit J [Bdellovibrio sp.]
MDNLDFINSVVTVFGIFAAICGLVLLFAKEPLSCALGLLGVLIFTAGIYAIIGEHFIATIQLVVYAGAIMVLFIFSIMLFNVKHDRESFNWKSPLFLFTSVVTAAVFVLLGRTILQYFDTPVIESQKGIFTREMVTDLGGNSQVLAHSLFTQHFVSFEAISLALLIALVGAVVLAKRKLN